MLDYVDLETARTASGTRIVTSGLIASPWGEAAKALFAIGGVPAQVVAKTRENGDAINQWTGVDNVPVVLHDTEPARTNWSAIVGLAARLAPPDSLVPVEPGARAEVVGLLEMIAGEAGLGWTSRLAMMQASFESGGARGFSVPIATYLAKRYGHSTAIDIASVRERVAAQLAVLKRRLGGQPYFGGDRPSALDIYAATFLTPLSEIDDTVCPQMSAASRRGFAAAREQLADLVPSELWAHRTMMFDRHLVLPIRLA